MNEDDLLDVALAFRAAILKIPVAMRLDGMKNFPCGACGDTTLLLGAHLVDLGECGFEYAAGVRGKHDDNSWHTHAWLKRGHLVIDLTCDQFSDAPAGFVFQKSPWHRTFRDVELSDSDFRYLHGIGIDGLHPMYKLIQSNL